MVSRLLARKLRRGTARSAVVPYPHANHSRRRLADPRPAPDATRWMLYVSEKAPAWLLASGRESEEMSEGSPAGFRCAQIRVF